MTNRNHYLMLAVGSSWQTTSDGAMPGRFCYRTAQQPLRRYRNTGIRLVR